MRRGNIAAKAVVGWVSCAVIASACGDKEGVIPTTTESLMPADAAGAPPSPMPTPAQSNSPPAAGQPARAAEGNPIVAPPPPMTAPTPAQNGTPNAMASDCPLDREVLERAAPATYALVFEALDANGEIQPVFTATAFAVGPNLLATNSHVTLALRDLMTQAAYEDVVAVQAGTGTVVPLDLAVTHPGFTGNPLGEPDVGLLTTRDTLPATLELAPADGVTSVGVTDDIYVVGFPGDIDEVAPTIPGVTIPQATALPGDVTALRNFDPSVAVTPTTTDIIQHDAATSPGMSGSPMLHCGIVVGVNNAGTIKQVLTPDANGNLLLDRLSVANNNFAIDIKHLLELMREFAAGEVATVDLNAHPPVVAPAAMPPAADLCSETCTFTGDGECDDGGPGSLTALCALGTDCTDCGPRSAMDAPSSGSAPPGTPPAEAPPAEAPPSDAPAGPLASPAFESWLQFTDSVTGDVCDTVNGADFEAIVLSPSNELMLVNVDASDGETLTPDAIVPGLTVDTGGNIIADGALTGGVVAFALDGDGNNRLWAFLPDGTLLSSSAALAGLTPDQLTDTRCDACGAVDQPPAGLCP